MRTNKKILVIGKKNHLGWTEHTINGFLSNGCEVKYFFTNQLSIKNSIKKGFSKLFKNKKFEAQIQLNELHNLFKLFKPDLAFFTGAFFSNILLYQYCKNNNITTAGWVGDKFGAKQAIYANFIDFLFVSDSAFINIAKNLNFKNIHFLQFGYDYNLHKDLGLKRNNSINFVGSYTKEREKIFSYLKNSSLQIYGSKWNLLEYKSPQWNIHNKKITQEDVVKIYNKTLATINIAQKANIINMVNMRTFEAIACGSCMINDYVKDIELCFEPNKEILVYNTPEELQDITQKAIKDKKFTKQIVENAKKRITKSKYSYKDRINNILSICDI